MGCFCCQCGVTVDHAYLADVTESIDVWHRGGFVRAQNYFPRLLFEFHAKLVQAQGFGFRGSAWGRWKETTQGEHWVTTQERDRERDRQRQRQRQRHRQRQRERQRKRKREIILFDFFHFAIDIAITSSSWNILVVIIVTTWRKVSETPKSWMLILWGPWTSVEHTTNVQMKVKP